MVRGNHDVRVGFNLRANQLNTVAVGFPNGFWVVTGQFTGDPAADLLTGSTAVALHDQEFDGGNTGRRWKLYRPFVEDNWRVGKSLTLNLGLAWAMMTPETEVGNRMSDFDPATGQFLVAGVNAGASAGIQMDWTALGATPGRSVEAVRQQYRGARRLCHLPRLVVEPRRAGVVAESTVLCGIVCRWRPTCRRDFKLFNAPPTPAEFEGTILAQDRNFKQGRIQQFNVNVEQEIPGEIVLTAGYAGARSSHLLEFGNDINVGSPGACGTTTGYTLGCGPGGAAFGIPYPAFPYSDIANIYDAGLAHYNSLQVKAETKSAKYGIYGLIGYTYSRAYDTGLTDGLGSIIGATYFPLPNWQKLDWGLSQINLNQNFTASIIYNLPFGKGRKWGSNWNSAANALLGGWETTVIEHATSGFPIFVVDSNNTSGAGLLNTNAQSFIRPNQTCDPRSGVSSLSEFFNVSCFSQPAPGELGNASRTPLSGPDFVNTDFSVIKQFVPREGWRVDFRAEFFNLFNHPQFGAPGGNGSGADFNSPTFAVINYTVNNPRVVQFGLKLAF